MTATTSSKKQTVPAAWLPAMSPSTKHKFSHVHRIKFVPVNIARFVPVGLKIYPPIRMRDPSGGNSHCILRACTAVIDINRH
jgi:hypothetical protein